MSVEPTTSYVMTYDVCSYRMRYLMLWATHSRFSASYPMRYRIRYSIQCFIWFKFWGPNGLSWAWMTSASFADSYSDCSITGTVPVLLHKPDSIATPCFPIPPRLANPPISEYQACPGICFRFTGLQPGVAAQHAENCSMPCHRAATTAAARAQQAAASVKCSRHEFVTLLILEFVYMQGSSVNRGVLNLGKFRSIQNTT